MKTKKLWALLIAAVMVIGLLPITAFAGAERASAGAPSPVLGLSLGTKDVAFSASDFTAVSNNDTADTVTVSKTIDISYDDIATGSLLLSVNGINGTKATVISSNITGAGLTGEHIVNFSTNVSFTSKVLGTTGNTIQFIVTDTVGGAWWNHDNNADSDVVVVVYNVTFKVTSPTTYEAAIATGSRGATAPVITVDSALDAYDGSSTASIFSPKASKLSLTAPDFKNPNTNENFAYWRFNKSLEVESVDGSPSNVGTVYGSSTDVQAGDRITTYVPQGTDATKFLMPADKVTITAVDAKGNDFGTNNAGTNPANPQTGLVVYYSNASVTINSSTSGYKDGSNYIRGLATGDRLTFYSSETFDSANDFWSLSPSPATSGATGVSSYYANPLTITVGTQGFSVYFNDYDNNTGTRILTIGSSSYGSATADDYSLTADQYVRVYATPDTGYYFSGWSTSSNVEYESGYSSTSNPTYIKLTGNGTITPSFTYGYDPYYYYGYGYGYGYPSGYYPGYTYPTTGTGTNTNTTNANEFGTGTLKATVSTSGVTAGYNASGSINSTNTVLAVQRYFRAYPTATTLNLAIPMGATAMSTSTARKIMNAAGTSRTVNLVGNASFGTVSYALTTARNYYFQMSSAGSRYTNARNTIVRAYGNSDTRGFSMQTNSLGASGTFKIKLSSLGLSAGPGDTVYALFYNPSTNGFTRKTLVVNSAGEVNYATARGGVHLFSESPFAK
jgi:hypothetical protein